MDRRKADTVQDKSRTTRKGIEEKDGDNIACHETELGTSD